MLCHIQHLLLIHILSSPATGSGFPALFLVAIGGFLKRFLFFRSFGWRSFFRVFAFDPWSRSFLAFFRFRGGFQHTAILIEGVLFVVILIGSEIFMIILIVIFFLFFFLSRRFH
jgi:hypothetical protein